MYREMPPMESKRRQASRKCSHCGIGDVLYIPGHGWSDFCSICHDELILEADAVAQGGER